MSHIADPLPKVICVAWSLPHIVWLHSSSNCTNRGMKGVLGDILKGQVCTKLSDWMQVNW